MQKIGKSVYVETQLRGADHGFVVTSEGVVLIDTPPYPTDAVKLRDTIAKYGPLRYVIITEPHADHWYGTPFFDAPVIAHEGTRQAMVSSTDAKERWMKMLTDRDPASLPLVPKKYEFRIPTITVSERMTLYMGKHTFQIVNYPGHTPYQLGVIIPEERVCFTSDNIFHKIVTWLQQADPDAWIASLKKMGELDVDVFVPGHGTTCDKSYLPEQAAIIQAWVDAVKAGIKKGLTMQQMQDNCPYKDQYLPEWGTEQMAKDIPRMSVAHLYEILKK